MKRMIINLVNKIINKVKIFINERPRLRCYIYSVIAAAFEGRMAEFMFVDYVYYISSNVVEAIIKKHPRYFFGAFFRKHVNKLTLRGFILRECLISYLMLLLNELDQAKRHEWFRKRHEERMAELRVEMRIWFSNFIEPMVNYFVLKVNFIVNLVVGTLKVAFASIKRLIEAAGYLRFSAIGWIRLGVSIVSLLYNIFITRRSIRVLIGLCLIIFSVMSGLNLPLE